MSTNFPLSTSGNMSFGQALENPEEREASQLATQPEPESRAAYSSRRRSRPLEELKPQKRHRLQNLQLRMVVYTVIVNVILLGILQVAQFGFGYYKVFQAEIESAKTISARLEQFIEKDNRPDSTKVATVERLLYNFLSQEVPDHESTMLGYVDGELRINQGSRGILAHEDKELMQAIAPLAKVDRQKFVSIRTDVTRYTVGVIPIKVQDGDSGTLMIVTDHNQAMESIWGFSKLFAGLSLLVLALVTLVSWRISYSLLAPIRTLREMISSVKADRGLNKRIPVYSNDELSQVAHQANEIIERLEGSVEAQRNLLEAVGHELRTPITVLKGHLELMDPNDPQACAHTRQIGMESLLQMHRLAEDLMAVAWIDRADFLHPKEQNIGEIIMELYEDARQLGEYNWLLDQICLADVNLDEQRMRQAVLQLCQNATKFSASGSTIRIGVGMDCDPQVLDVEGQVCPTELIYGPDQKMEYRLPTVGSGHYLCIWVADQGIGISPENQLQIFQRFARVSHERPGSGLGLPIVTAIAQAHGGYLTLRSVPNVGSVFRICIPVTDEVYEAAIDEA